MSIMKTVNIDLGDRKYDITIGSDLIKDLPDFLPFDMSGRKAFIIADENTKDYAEQVQSALQEAGASFADTLVLPFGESTKSFSKLEQTYDWMLENAIHRNSVVFAVGGGVIGDLAGYAASTILRGVPYVQVPTTLLSQVDSSVGGKTGVNTPHGKNLVGSFYQPAAVIADIDTLKTLPKRQILAGYAEVVKYGLLGDFAFFEWLEKNGQSVVKLDEGAIAYAIELSCKAKAAVVEADEREGGRRALLNLGHTFGHALEAAAGYDGTLLHGEGVSIGTVMAFDLSCRMGLCTIQEQGRVTAHFEKIGLPVNAYKIEASVDQLIATMRRDKKAMDNKMIFILVDKIGNAFVSRDVPEDLVRSVLEHSLGKG